MLVISIRFADTAILAIYKKAGCDPRPDKRSTLARVADRAGTRIGSDTRGRRNMGQTKPSPASGLGREFLEARHFLFRKQEADQVGQHGTFRLSLLARGDAVDDKLAQLF